MRKDMPKLIVKGHSRSKDSGNRPKMKFCEFEDAPERESMKRREDLCYSGPIDHINPLYNFLKENIGRPWAKVYAEICAVADARSFAGKHLREHIDREVLSEEAMIVLMERRWYHGGMRDFYYDAKGILCCVGDRVKNVYREKRNPNECAIDGKPYLRINGCWFEGEHYTIPTQELSWQYVPNERKMRLMPQNYTRSVKQLNKKELKRLGLSNAPEWKWWKK